MYWETVHTEKIDGFDIRLDFTPEDSTPDWDFADAEDEAETLRKIDIGELLWFVARVTASKRGIDLGEDYLGGCCYESVDSFLVGGYYADMVTNAISTARDTLVELAA